MKQISFSRRISNVLVLLLSFLFPSFMYGISGYDNMPQDTLSGNAGKEQPVYTATRLVTEKPVIDGKLDDACWTKGTWAGDYTQFIPREGAEPTYPTYHNIQYDDKNLYVAFRAVDYEPERINRYAGGREEFVGDIVGINFDSYHDRWTGFEFNLTAWGQKIDDILYNPENNDFNWNAVWTGKTGTEDTAWVAEMEIPLSQLRFSKEKEQVWGMHTWRWLDRLQEESNWEKQTRTGPGMLYNFGELRGISNLKKTRRLEVMPYILGKLNTVEKEPENPFIEDGRLWGGSMGLDAKVGISSNFTLDITVNPDFGQVESDPSVMNLTVFETFYEEKRPFFLEGLTIFDFDFEDQSLFYSRRIGHSPSLTIRSGDSLFVRSDDKSTILSAVKLSGKTANGLSLGFIQSLTANEKAEIRNTDNNSTEKEVEPLTSYTVARVQKQFNEGISMVGGIFTATNRIINDPDLEFLTRNAYSGGVDMLHQWRDQEFYLRGALVGSYVNGSEQAISILQESSARYYQRPGTNYLDYDTTGTSLSGFGGRVRIGKGSKGFWRYSTGGSWLSPGLELNDIGYLRRADYIRNENDLSYFVNQPVSVFRSYTISMQQFNTWNFNRDYLGSGANLSLRASFMNRWSVTTRIIYESKSLDPRLLRGGFDLMIPHSLSLYGRLGTNTSKRVALSFTPSYSVSGSKSAESYGFNFGLTLRPVNALKIELTGNYADNYDQLQYITTRDFLSEKRYILGTLDQQTFGITVNVDMYITPELSIQYYGSPFISRGSYDEFKYITDPRADNYDDRFFLYDDPLLSDQYYSFDEDNDLITDYSIYNPDFNFHQFRSNLVAKWEYRPGSFLYVVWSSERTGNADMPDVSVNDSFKQLWKVYPRNIFLVKINYWFSL